MKKTLTILMIILMGCGMNCLAQGKVTRPTKQQTQTSKPKKTIPKVSVSEPDGYINGHGYVDLGLPSGLKWATCNIGASSTSDYGNYYAWGETQTKSSYTDDNSLTMDKYKSELRSSGIIDSSGNLTMPHDAANANWGGSWRMPVTKDFLELIDNCSWIWASQGGHNGYKVTGPNGHSIFVPAAGSCLNGGNLDSGKEGMYWESGCDGHQAAGVLATGLPPFDINSSVIRVILIGRQVGNPIRPVSE